jgi:hypothetical protein
MKTILCIILSALTFILVIWLIYKYGKNQMIAEDEYDKLYDEISGEINDREVTVHNYDILMYKLGKLGKLKYKNKEKTSVLFTNFLIKFKAEAEKRI